MRLVTIVSLGASAVLGVAALLVAKTVLPGQPANAAAAAPAHTVPVVVAARPLTYGTRLAAQNLTIEQLPPETAPPGAFATIEAALQQDHGGAPVVLAPMAAKEVVLPGKLSGPGARPSLAANISDGMRAFTVRVNEVSGVGGHALPGDRVDVLLTRNLSSDDASRYLVSEVVLQNVRLMGVDLNADPTSTEVDAPKTATLEVSVEDAQKLAVAADLGNLSLALRRVGAAELEATTPIETADVSTRAPVRAPRAAAPDPAAPRRAPADRARGATPIVVIEGDKPAEGA